MILTPKFLAWPETTALLTAFEKAGADIRFVGGCVRDALLRIEAHDIDMATPLAPKAVMKLLKKLAIQVIPTGIKYGTVTAIIGKKKFEITSLREDISTNGRWAKVKFTHDWQKDAARRDFTMNAIYLSRSGQLFDYFGGEVDARAGHVRFIGNPEARVTEDYLRALRFFRFNAHFGAGKPDEDGLAACIKYAPKLKALSGERVAHELFKLLAAPRFAATIELMHKHRILEHMLGIPFGNLDCFARFERIEDVLRIRIAATIKINGLLFGLGAQMPPQDVLHTLAERLRLSKNTQQNLSVASSSAKEFAPDLSPGEQKQLIRKLGPDHFCAALVVAWAIGKEKIAPDHPYAQMLTFAEEWAPPQFPVTGTDLIALGIKPGKQMGELLKTLETRWEKSGYEMNKTQLMKLAALR